MKIVFIVISSAFLLTACAQAPHTRPEVLELQRFAASAKPMAENGSMKWSAYYEGLYNREIAASSSGELLTMANDAWRAAQQYEAGSISKADFEYQQRAIRARATSISAAEEQAEQARRAQQAAAILSLRANLPAPYQIVPPAPLAPISSIQPLPGLPAAGTVNAFWTGKQQQVQTVTNQAGWNCEYNYAGQTFWRTYTGFCPASIQVR